MATWEYAGTRVNDYWAQEWCVAVGNAQHPAWFLNLRDNPHVEVAYMGKPKNKMTTRIAPDVERQRMWPLVTASYKGYAGYKTKTTREIPLVILNEA